MLIDTVAVIAVLLWIYLIAARGQFWTASIRDVAWPPAPANWPSVAVVIPARNEASCIGASVRSLLSQDYQGPLSVIVVDDDSNDKTAAVAARVGVQAERQLTVMRSRALPSGWTGKLWALKQGIAVAEGRSTPPDYILLTDADIVHAPDTVAWLVAKAKAGGFVLTSLMAKLRCESLAERSHVPAFVYFFQMVFPFSWVGRPGSPTAAAAGGCMLIRADALRICGGIDRVRNALIDDCTLAAMLKSCGPVWLGLTDRVRSVRPYDRLADVRQMISRSAYAQLGYSPLLLAATLAGLALVFVAPVLLALFAHGLAQGLGFAAWLAMALSFQPMLRFYRLSPLWGVALPATALLYACYTLDSAYRHTRRRGGVWKGRVHVNAPSLP
jgi:hopene-associated glycosyltransferase HpnB